MRGLLGSLRYTIRVLLKSPGFTVTAVLILGFGIGTNTAIFSLIDAVILKPLPYPDPDRLVQICQPYQNDPFSWIDYPDYVDTIAAQHSFESLAVMHDGILALSGNGEPQDIQVHFVSPSIFKVSGVPTVLGRVFTDQEDIPNGPMLVVLSERYWRTRFQSDPKIIGRNLTLSDNSFQVIGVASAQVSDWGPPGADIYAPVNTLAPLGFLPNDRGYPLALRDLPYFFCVGRLKAGISVAQAQADLEIIHKNLLSRYPEFNQGSGISVIPLLDRMVHDYAATTWLLGAAVGCLLLISCANVASLLFARGLQRRREIMIRATLGATRWRLISQLLLETFFLSILGGVLGLLIALASAGTIKELSPPNLYRFQGLSVDWHALMFVFCVILLTSLLSGLLPAWHLSQTNLVPALKEEGGRGGTGGRQRDRTQSALVTAQVALACVLLIGAGLLVRSFQAAQNVPLGFNPHHLVTARINLSSPKYETDGVRTRAFWDEAITKTRLLPGVTVAALDDLLPLKYTWERRLAFTIDGQPDPGPGRQPVLTWQMISKDYFRTMQVPILQGRDFNPEDRADKASVVVVDKTLAEQYFPNQNPLGKSISVHDPEGIRDCTIVGIVPHLRYQSPGQAETAFQAYFPVSQWDYDGAFLILRSELAPAALTPGIREIITSIDPDVPVEDVSAYDDIIAQNFVTRRLSMLLVGLFSGAALVLSAIGLYGILAYAVGQRTREIGVRVAVGAQPSDILRLITEQGVKIVALGLVAGLIAALVLARFVGGLLYGVTGTDPVSIATAVLILGLAASLACLLPALRATRIDPIEALRE
jgi:putative ABC transport system permease protein